MYFRIGDVRDDYSIIVVKEGFVIKIISVLLSMFVIILLLMGCSFSKAKLTNEFAATKDDHFTLVAIAKNGEQIKELNYHLSRSLSNKSLENAYPAQLVWALDNGKRNYTKAFHIKKYPTFLVFDTENLVLETTNIKEVNTFFSNK